MELFFNKFIYHTITYMYRADKIDQLSFSVFKLSAQASFASASSDICDYSRGLLDLHLQRQESTNKLRPRSLTCAASHTRTIYMQTWRINTYNENWKPWQLRWTAVALCRSSARSCDPHVVGMHGGAPVLFSGSPGQLYWKPKRLTKQSC